MKAEKALSEFKNEPFTDFTVEENAAQMREAIELVKSELGREYPMIIGGEQVSSEKKFESINPARKTEIVGRFFEGDEEIVNRAVETAFETFKTWRDVSPADRADYLFRAAAILRERKHYYSAWMIHEVGKTWAEADGDTAEAIDFLEFYAREMLRYASEQPLTKIEGEDNRLGYIPLGVAAVIPPWNFPLAIMAGMTVAAVVTGNTVVLKPSSDAPTIAAKFVEVLQEVGLPAGVVNFVTGGAEAGEAMVVHPKTRFIAFTGSKQVGLHINEQAAKTREGQIWIKRVIAEMGGKDAIIVDEDADIDSAATGVTQAAFGYQGQKCSACSRLIVNEKVHDELVSKVVALTEKLKLATPEDPTTNLSAVINQRSFDNTLRYIEIAQQEGGRVLTGGGGNGEEGFYIEPTIIDDVKPKSTLEQEEVFAPVLAVIKARDFDHALEIANDTEFGLTGAVYTSSEEKLERARNKFHVGNLYLNRKCTGALVGVHPFGGFNMSGTDSKAGGRDYLGLFMQAKLVSAKIDGKKEKNEQNVGSAANPSAKGF
ncbi:MAG TPA: L-glutamate gamma-semialdehyde dehydrogenase [Pyrinomonadaceae bacterium]|nr:L-glutamate gamma-semialdehyde dehydrogenase [Pyrinomonadaceae bacterium]